MTDTIAVTTTEVIEVTVPVVEVISVGVQGPAGPQGVQGPTGPTGLQGPPGANGQGGGSGLVLVAGAPLGGNRAVIDAVTYADNTNPAHMGKVIGVTGTAVNAGDQVNIISAGELDGFFGLVLGPVYLSVNGTVTQTPPSTGFIQQIGVAVSATKAIINISTPILQV